MALMDGHRRTGTPPEPPMGSVLGGSRLPAKPDSLKSACGSLSAEIVSSSASTLSPTRGLDLNLQGSQRSQSCRSFTAAAATGNYVRNSASTRLSGSIWDRELAAYGVVPLVRTTGGHLFSKVLDVQSSDRRNDGVAAPGRETANNLQLHWAPSVWFDSQGAR